MHRRSRQSFVTFELPASLKVILAALSLLVGTILGFSMTLLLLLMLQPVVTLFRVSSVSEILEIETVLIAVAVASLYFTFSAYTILSKGLARKLSFPV